MRRVQNVRGMALEPPRALRPQAQEPAIFIGAVQQERHRVTVASQGGPDGIRQSGRIHASSLRPPCNPSYAPSEAERAITWVAQWRFIAPSPRARISPCSALAGPTRRRVLALPIREVASLVGQLHDVGIVVGLLVAHVLYDREPVSLDLRTNIFEGLISLDGRELHSHRFSDFLQLEAALPGTQAPANLGLQN